MTIMRKLIQRSVLRSIRHMCGQSVGSASLHHVATRVMPGGRNPFVGIRGFQASACMSQGAATISLDDPVMIKYISSLLGGNECDKTAKRQQTRHILKELMLQRDLILKNIRSLNELKQGNLNFLFMTS